MTNGPGKSDRPEVPVKSPNKAGQSAAEGMEGRGLAKGNLPQQNAFRTPSREDALSALERVRQAAAKDKKLRFTTLLHHIYNLETLRTAYLSLKKDLLGSLMYSFCIRNVHHERDEAAPELFLQTIGVSLLAYRTEHAKSL